MLLLPIALKWQEILQKNIEYLDEYLLWQLISDQIWFKYEPDHCGTHNISGLLRVCSIFGRTIPQINIHGQVKLN